MAGFLLADCSLTASLSGSLRTSARIVMQKTHNDTVMSTLNSVCDKSCELSGLTAYQAQPTIMHGSLVPGLALRLN